jgi:hypothetical protein
MLTIADPGCSFPDRGHYSRDCARSTVWTACGGCPRLHLPRPLPNWRSTQRSAGVLHRLSRLQPGPLRHAVFWRGSRTGAVRQERPTPGSDPNNKWALNLLQPPDPATGSGDRIQPPDPATGSSHRIPPPDLATGSGNRIWQPDPATGSRHRIPPPSRSV